MRCGLKNILALMGLLVFTAAAPAQTSTFPCDDARFIALEISGDLIPPEALTDQIYNELALIYDHTPAMSRIHYSPAAWPGTILIDVGDSIGYLIANQQYQGFDSLDAIYGEHTREQLFEFSYQHWMFDFDACYNPGPLAEIYGQAPGVENTWVDYMFGDGDAITAAVTDTLSTYTFRHGWGDCPAGCIDEHFWTYQIQNGVVTLISSSGDSILLADFSVDRDSGYVPLTVQFTDMSLIGVDGDAAWQWDFNGDGSVDSQAQHPSFTYTTPGDYTVALTITAGNLSNTKTAVDTIHADLAIRNAPVFRLPATSRLYPNYPNPFNAGTRIGYDVATPGRIELAIYNLRGQKIRTLVDETRPAGHYGLTLNAADLASGLYFYRLKIAGRLVDLDKLVVVR